MARKRPMIGLVMSGLEVDYTSAVSRGVVTAAEDYDCNLVIFTGRYIDGNPADPADLVDQIVINHHNTVYSYASEKNLDFLIVPFGTLCSTFDPVAMKSFLDSFGNIPKISLSIEAEGCACVRYDCRPGLTSLINHIITEHGCRRIAFIAGHPDQSDSNERLGVYKDVLAAHNIPFDPRLVVHGNLSEYCDDVVEDFLIGLHYDVDAICCANDSTAEAVYKVLNRAGIVPGKDIIVTGYDNLPGSASCSPSLSTVSANAYESSYRAVQMGVECLREGKPFYSITLPTNAVLRESCCGLSCFTGDTVFKDISLISDLDVIVDHWITSTEPETQVLLSRLINSQSRRFLSLLFSEIENPEISEISVQKLADLFRDFSRSAVVDTSSGSSLCDLLSIIQGVAFSRVSSPEKEKQLYSLFVSLYRIAICALDSINYSLNHEMRRTLDFTNSMSGHIGSYGKDMGLAMMTILEYLSKLGISDCYLYLEENPIPIRSPEDVKPFESIRLFAYQCGSEYHSLKDKQAVIDRYSLFSNRFIDNRRRRTMMVSPLFSSMEQYGLLVCDISYQHMTLFQAAMSQINSTIESVYLFSRLNKQLNETENENVILSNIATRDALTGCYNRLGFFERAGSAIISPLNFGRRGFAIYADVNCLKQINDSYSHDDGDHALCTVVEAFSECFDNTAIIGRIGGDEFVIVWLTSDSSWTRETVRKRMKECLARHDEASDYPYHVSTSLGVYDFVCSEDLSLENIIDQADRLQYVDKAQKPDFIAK